MDVAAHRLQIFDPRARQGEEVVLDPLEMLADDVQPRIGQKMMDVGDPPGDRVLDGQHGELGLAVAHRRHSIVETAAGQRHHVGKDMAAGEIGIGAGGALECYRVGGIRHRAIPGR